MQPFQEALCECAGGTYVPEGITGSFGRALGSFWVSARRRGSQGGLAQPQSFPATGSGGVSARGSATGEDLIRVSGNHGNCIGHACILLHVRWAIVLLRARNQAFVQ